MSVDAYMRPRLDADQALDPPILGGSEGVRKLLSMIYKRVQVQG